MQTSYNPTCFKFQKVLFNPLALCAPSILNAAKVSQWSQGNSLPPLESEIKNVEIASKTRNQSQTE